MEQQELLQYLALPVSISWLCRRLSPLDRHVLKSVIDNILDGGFFPAVVGDVVVEQLRRPRVLFLVVFVGDIGGHLFRYFFGLGGPVPIGGFPPFVPGFFWVSSP